MKARVIERSHDKVTVRLTPNWIARAFGALDHDLDLERCYSVDNRGYPCFIWVCPQSRVRLTDLPYKRKINRAITYKTAPPSFRIVR